MTTPMRSKNQLLCAKLETTYDTDSVPVVGTDSLLAIDPKIKEVIDSVERPGVVASLSRNASIAGAKYAEVTFSVELKGSGSAGTAPRLGCLFRACGMGETVVGATSVTYAPVSASFESVTIYLFIDGRRHVVTGCRGDWKAKCEAGKQGLIEFTLKGRYADPTNVALSAPTLETSIPPICKSCVFTYNSKTTLVVKATELEIGNTVSPRPSLSDANAIAGFEITERKPMLTIDPEAILETSYSFRGDALTTLRAISWVVGATAGNICTFSIPKYNPYWPEYEDRDGILVEKIKGELTRNSNNDEISIAFT